MDHGAHAGHDMPMVRCKMNMLWNTDIIDTCVVFRSWHIHTYTHFYLSIIAIVALGVLYEYLRIFAKKLDFHIAQSLVASNRGKGASRSRDRSNSPSNRAGGSDTPNGAGGNYEELGLLSGKLLKVQFTGTPVPTVSRALRAIVYGASVFLSFFLMLVFMTYNAYLIAAVVVGAALGHYVFGATMDTDSILNNTAGDKGMACH